VPASHHPAESLKVITPDGIIENCRNVTCDDHDECLDDAASMCVANWACAHCPCFPLGPQVKGGVEGGEAAS